jgi:Na+-transporting methylmalonyl-CoA/oxaloacetate decarboxylase gamma subunit
VEAAVGLLSDMLGLAVVVLVTMLLILVVEGIKLTSDALKQRRRMKREIEE